MIGHQAVGVHVALELDAQLPKDGEVRQVVAVMLETETAVVSALNDVNSHAG
jgi:hypothetical protein